ncbi:MAG: 7-carboxy-7-deazaguanine synthase QueE, partial [Coxiellaceae bacterium]|nr:7-carboxy-7-deazaguanine synthase QueE [Coxiellaceae bacterium]
FKTPGSQEVDKNRFENITSITKKDQIKFVVCDREDYLWTKAIINQYALTDKCEVLLSPSYQELENQQLADWIIEDNLPVRFQLQLHKAIWGDKPGC